MTTSSQDLNPAYGYLWWLNGSDEFMLPGSQLVFPGSFSAAAPADTYVAAGKNGQFINVVPSEGLVWIRMGDAPDNALVPVTLNNEIWEHLDLLPCVTAVRDPDAFALAVRPNPATDYLEFDLPGTGAATTFQFYDLRGALVLSGATDGRVVVSELPPGVYHLRVLVADRPVGSRWVVLAR